MQVKLSSRQREILDHGTVFLFDEKADLTMNIAENSFRFTLSIHFTEDGSGNQNVEKYVLNDRINITCTNFAARGAGLSVPMELAVVNGKKIYFMFWSYLEGEMPGKPKARKVEYTLYSD